MHTGTEMPNELEWDESHKDSLGFSGENISKTTALACPFT